MHTHTRPLQPFYGTYTEQHLLVGTLW